MLNSTPGWLQTERVQKHRWWRGLLWVSLLALLMARQVVTSHPLLAAEAIALSDPWRFVDESKPGAPMVTGELANAATDAPTQVAARFAISSTMQALALQLNDAELAGLPLGQVEELSYCTRLVDGPRPYAVTLQINIDADVTDADQSWQGRLVYTPSYNGAVIQGEWQCWNTLVGKWWATGGPVAAQAPSDSPQPLGRLLAYFPNLGINATYSVVTLKAGDGWNSFQGEASPVVIAVEGERLDIAFGTPTETPIQENTEAVAEGNEILLPILVNEAPPPAAPPAIPPHPDDKPKEEKPHDKPEHEKPEKEKPKDAWPITDWGNVNWATFDWENFDWDKVDWEHLDWGIWGWGGDDHAEAVRAFVEDVKQCKEGGWEALGYSNPGDCVAYYIEAHTPDNLDWSNIDWGRGWNSDDNNNDDNNGNHRGNRNRRGNRGNNDD